MTLEETKNLIESTLEELSYDNTDVDKIVEALNHSYSAIDILEKELDKVTQNSYNYMEKYTWLAGHCPPRGVATAAGIPWSPIGRENPSAYIERINQYVEWGLLNDRTHAVNDYLEKGEING